MSSAKLPSVSLAAGSLAVLPAVALAHPAASQASGLGAGLAHPLTGWDHVAVLLAIGAWIAQAYRDKPWVPSGVFLSAIVAGGIAGASLSAPVIFEGTGVASVAALGLLLALAAQPALGLGLAAIALFGIIQGMAHGGGIPVEASMVAYTCGLGVVSIILQGSAAAAARWIEDLSRPLLRLGGGLLAAGAAGAAFI